MASNRLSQRRGHVDRPPVCRVSLADGCPPAEVILETTVLQAGPPAKWTILGQWLLRPPAEPREGELEVIINHGLAIAPPEITSTAPFLVTVTGIFPGQKLWARAIITTTDKCVYLGHAFARVPIPAQD